MQVRSLRLLRELWLLLLTGLEGSDLIMCKIWFLLKNPDLSSIEDWWFQMFQSVLIVRYHRIVAGSSGSDFLKTWVPSSYKWNYNPYIYIHGLVHASLFLFTHTYQRYNGITLLRTGAGAHLVGHTWDPSEISIGSTSLALLGFFFHLRSRRLWQMVTVQGEQNHATAKGV